MIEDKPLEDLTVAELRIIQEEVARRVTEVLCEFPYALEVHAFNNDVRTENDEVVARQYQVEVAFDDVAL